MYVTESVYIISFTELSEVKIVKLKKKFSYILLILITNPIFRCNQRSTAQGPVMPVYLCVSLSDSNIKQCLNLCQVNWDIYETWNLSLWGPNWPSLMLYQYHLKHSKNLLRPLLSLSLYINLVLDGTSNLSFLGP